MILWKGIVPSGIVKVIGKVSTSLEWQSAPE
jgi:hypothetical protein